MQEQSSRQVGLLGAIGSGLSSRMLAALLVFFVLVPIAFGQEVRGTISGLVSDAQGASIAGAKVEIKSVETNLVNAVQTNEAGLYAVPLLPIGHYNVAVTATGFKHSERSGIEVRSGDRLQVDFRLEVGALTESIEITAQAPLLETSASREQVISDQAVASIPSEGRNAFLTSLLTAGVMFPNYDTVNAVRPFDNGGMDAMLMNGGVMYRNNYTINGLPDTSNENTSTAAGLTFVPPPDAVRQVSVSTNSYDAQYGHSGGGTINVDLKSGTNQVHGAAYEYVRNTILNANRWENNANNVARTPYHWNEPGVEIDAPVYIPKLYNGKDKTFFMFSWERIQDSIPQPYTASVPTADQRTGNFATTTSNGAPITIFDPLTTVQTSPGVYSRTPFAGNIVPSARINPMAAKLMTLYPAANASGTIDHLNNYFYGGSVVQDKYDAFSTTVDQNINAKNRTSFSYFQSGRHQIEPTYGFPDPAASPLYLHWRVNHGASANWTATLNSTTVFDVRYGFERHNFAIQYYNFDYDPTQLGFPPSLVSQFAKLTFPQFSVTGYTGLGNNTSTFVDTNTHALQSTLTKIVGKHTVKIGAQFNTVFNNYNSPTSSSGTMTFNTTFTQLSPLVSSALQGNSFASELLGYPASGSVPVNGSYAYAGKYYAAFVQDDWRVQSRLTLSFGLRWDVETPITERYNQLNAGFGFGQPSPLQVPGYNLAGGLLFVSSSNRNPYITDWNNIQPRIGAAYRLNDKTVLRGGFGVYYLPTFDPPGTQGFSTSTPFTASNDGNATPANTMNNPYPAGILRPSGSKSGLGTLMGTSISFADPQRTIPYNEQFSFGIQRQLPQHFVADVSYIGSRTHELEVGVNIDPISVANLSKGALLNTTVANPFAGLLPGTNLNAATITLQQSLLPYPQFTGVTENNIPIGSNWYNALQVRIERRFSAGLFLLMSYTDSKNMQATAFLNAQDGPAASGLERQLAQYDVPQNVRISGGYEIPLFKHNTGLMGKALGGWQLNANITFTSGQPVAAPGSAFSTGIDPNIPNQDHTAWFNTCYLNLSGVRTNCPTASTPPAWIQQPSFTLNALTAYLPNIRTRRPPLADVSLFKTFPIHERLKFQIRAEALNVTNTTWFPAANTTLTSPLFGQTVLATGGFSSTSNDPRAVQMSARITF